MDLASALRQVPIFSSLGVDELAAFVDRCRVRTMPRNVLVFCQGDPGEALYVIVEGMVKVFLSTSGGREVVLALERRGGYFGELSMIDRMPRSASVMTLRRTRLLVISRSTFRECLAAHPDVAYRLITGLSARVRMLTENVGALATDDVRKRVEAALLRLAIHRDGVWRIPERPSHQVIADMVGASREMTGKVMRELVRAGRVCVTARGMTLHLRSAGSTRRSGTSTAGRDGRSSQWERSRRNSERVR